MRGSDEKLGGNDEKLGGSDDKWEAVTKNGR